MAHKHVCRWSFASTGPVVTLEKLCDIVSGCRSFVLQRPHFASLKQLNARAFQDPGAAAHILTLGPRLGQTYRVFFRGVCGPRWTVWCRSGRGVCGGLGVAASYSQDAARWEVWPWVSFRGTGRHERPPGNWSCTGQLLRATWGSKDARVTNKVLYIGLALAEEGGAKPQAWR